MFLFPIPYEPAKRFDTDTQLDDLSPHVRHAPPHRLLYYLTQQLDTPASRTRTRYDTSRTKIMAPTPQPRSQELINVKLLLIGNSSVGKSSLLLRFSDKQWLPEDEASATIGVDFRVRPCPLKCTHGGGTPNALLGSV